jgi:hypothetical protein
LTTTPQQPKDSGVPAQAPSRSLVAGLPTIAHAACPVLSAWRDIETAPKDGSYFLVASAAGVWVAHWSPVAASGYRFDDPVRSVMLNHWHISPRSDQYLPPTHWMPLPPPPTTPPAVPEQDAIDAERPEDLGDAS